MENILRNDQCNNTQCCLYYVQAAALMTEEERMAAERMARKLAVSRKMRKYPSNLLC
jgi:hypothetical protein